MAAGFKFPGPAGLGLLACLCLAAGEAGARPAEAGLQTLVRQARAFEHGEGVPKDPERALQLYCKAARRGSLEAQFSLGWMYANGRGVPRDDASAAYFFTLAARQGDAYARRMLRHLGGPTARGGDCAGIPERGEGGEREEAPADDGMPGDEAPMAAGPAEGAQVAATPARRKVEALVFRLAPEYGINPHLALAVIHTESGFNPAAVSPRNAQGLMQLIPATSARFKVTRPFDPEDNIRGGLAYLRWLLAYFKGNVTLVAAAYNAGEGTVNRYRGIPPYAETREYVRRVKGRFRRDIHPYDQSVTAPSPELERIRRMGKA